MRIENILEKNEKIIWKGKPRFIPFLFGTNSSGRYRNDPSPLYPALPKILGIMSLFAFFIMLNIFFGELISQIYIFKAENIFVALVKSFQFILYFILVNDIMKIAAAFIILSFLYVIVFFRNIEYAFTNKRVIIKQGAIGTDFNYIDYDRITNILLNVGFFDKIFKTGSISIIPKKEKNPFLHRINRLSFCNIKNPRETFNLLKKTSYDIKSDIFYPNKYRQEGVNKGYFTKHESEKHE